MSSGSDIKRNIQEMVAGMDPPILPTTLLEATINPGDTTTQAAPLLDPQGRSRIVPGALFMIFDANAERILKITDVVPGAAPTDPVTLHFNWAGTVGSFQQTHTAGTVAYTSLGAFSPWTIGRMLELGDPAITISIQEKHSNATFQPGGGFPLYIVLLTYYRQFSKPNDVALDDDLWAEQQENLCVSDLERIEAMLFENQELTSMFHPSAAMQLGADGQTTDLIVTRFDWQPREGDIWDLTASMRISVLGLPE